VIISINLSARYSYANLFQMLVMHWRNYDTYVWVITKLHKQLATEA